MRKMTLLGWATPWTLMLGGTDLQGLAFISTAELAYSGIGYRSTSLYFNFVFYFVEPTHFRGKLKNTVKIKGALINGCSYMRVLLYRIFPVYLW